MSPCGVGRKAFIRGIHFCSPPIETCDAAEADRSASMGAGAWKRVSGNTFRGTFYEINATRATNQFESNLVVTFTVNVTGDTFTGTASARYLDADGNLLEGPFDGPLTGTRIEA